MKCKINIAIFNITTDIFKLKNRKNGIGLKKLKDLILMTNQYISIIKFSKSMYANYVLRFIQN